MAANNLGYFEGQITKYLVRWRKKGGYQDLLKAKSFMDKLLEVEGKKPKAEPEPCKHYERALYTNLCNNCGRTELEHNPWRDKRWKGYE